MELERLFNPQSVAVVGASRQPGKVGHEIIDALLRGGYEGKILPVNPQADNIEGLKCYPDLKSTGTVPDLVLIVVPAKVVPAVMEQCAELGVKYVVIITAGFKEVGEEGRKLEQAVVDTARRAKIRILGPNCLGLMVPGSKLNASFGGDLPEVGRIGYISQSGALLAAILDMAKANVFPFHGL